MMHRHCIPRPIASVLRYYRSSDATITASDTEVGTADSISALAVVGFKSSISESAYIGPSLSTAGIYYYGTLA